MKFTRSLPAKASASAKVPDRIVMRSMLMRNSCRNASSTEHATQHNASAAGRLWSIHTAAALSAKVLFSPLNSAK